MIHIRSSGFRRAVVLALVLVSLGFISGWFAHTHFDGRGIPQSALKEKRLSGYQFINPLLESELADDLIGDRELVPFTRKIKSYIEEIKKSRMASHVSVYFRDMNNGLAFNIKGQELFAPASLLKVPLMIAYLKWAESDPKVLTKRLTFTGKTDLDVNQNIKPLNKIVNGRSYSVDQLLRYSILYSDNNAHTLLFDNIPPSMLVTVYKDFNLTLPTFGTGDDFMSVSEYASLFRILYNASYLSKDMSEKALECLSAVDFKDGLVAGVPGNIVVAHKFGERTIGAKADIKQMHDCGIVYYPAHPYLLCIMTRGDSFEHLDDVIRNISNLIFQEIDLQRRIRN